MRHRDTHRVRDVTHDLCNHIKMFGQFSHAFMWPSGTRSCGRYQQGGGAPGGRRHTELRKVHLVDLRAGVVDVHCDRNDIPFRLFA